MASVYDALRAIYAKYTTAKDIGTAFEHAALYYLRNAPEWKNLLEDVQLWKECELYNGRDNGIDLVARSRAGEYWAVQCKCWKDSDTLNYKDTATFFATAQANPDYVRCLLITSDCSISSELRRSIEDSRGKFVLLTAAKMDESPLDWQSFIDGGDKAEGPRFTLRPDQQQALGSVLKAFETNERCRMIMACGTGKTFVSLRIAEALAPEGTVLFCAPSIALVSQACAAWNSLTSRNMRFLTVCSDSKASNAKNDTAADSLADLPYPATTNAQTLVQNYLHMHNGGGGEQSRAFTVIFTTYQSMPVIAEAHRLGLPAFDLIICDEAHRTTGVSDETLTALQASAFQLVHHEEHIHGRRRLYMTATPRIYTAQAQKSERGETCLFASMDDEAIYGPEAYYMPFDAAVEQGLLSDYKVVVLAVREDEVSPLLQESLSDGSELKLDEACKILGCYKGLVYHGEGPSASRNSEAAASRCSEGGEEAFAQNMYARESACGGGDYEPLIVADFSASAGGAAAQLPPLHRAVGFCHSIKASKLLNLTFNKIVDSYLSAGKEKLSLRCELDHVDGTMDSNRRHKILRWLAEDGADPQSCRLLTNARCLAEGVDVPALDAVIFFSPRKSKVDIIQAVGRVMRTFKGKRFGYIILPIFVPAGKTPEEALDNSDRFDVIWEVLQALRSHDRRIDARINAVSLNRKNAASLMNREGSGTRVGEPAAEGGGGEEQLDLDLSYSQRMQEAIYTKLVKRCGDRVYWESWAADVARIAQEHIKHLNELISRDQGVRRSFEGFLRGLREILNPAISAAQAVEMITQHMITVPVFNALFRSFEFKSFNPVSRAIESFLDCLPSRRVTDNEDDLANLEELYRSVARRAGSVSSNIGRQQLMKDLYEDFFSKAFRATKDKLGIVYTPGEVVEFILQFSNLVLKERFGKALADEGVHILDGFAGTGTFIAQLLSNPRLMPESRLLYKYNNELHSNEILLLAYYIMAVNIEQTLHARLRPDAYLPFPGAVLTDTFQMAEEDGSGLDSEVFSANHARALLQREKPVSVIIGNPPYSAGQKSANDNNQNDKYPRLDKRITDTYASFGKAVSQKNIYDSYIRAFRWATDRIGEKGVICFVSNAGWLRGEAMDGFRKCLREDFGELYIFDLRGNQRTKGEESRREGGKIFGQGSRAPISVTLLVKDGRAGQGRIFYCDVGDYLTREQKLKALLEAAARCAEGLPVSEILPWRELTPDRYNDWLDHRTDEFDEFAPMAINKGKEPFGIFDIWSLGIASHRDIWVYNYNENFLKANIKGLIERSNAEIERVNSEQGAELTYNVKMYSWARGLINTHVNKNKKIKLENDNFVIASYRPFCQQFLYYERSLHDMIYQVPRLFPLPSESGAGFCVSASPGQLSINLRTMLPEPNPPARERLKNIVITVTNDKHGCSVLAAGHLPDLHFNGDSQCFPFYRYEPAARDDMFSSAVRADFVRHEAVTDQALSVFKRIYPYAYAQRPKSRGGAGLNKLDIFCCIYAVLHHPEYKKRFAVNLSKELPRIPFVGCAGCSSEQEMRIKGSARFEAFAEIGRQLLQLHVNYEEAEPYKVKEVWSKSLPEGVGPENPGPVVKLAWAKRRDPETGKSVEDYGRLVYNANLMLEGLPERAQDYTINGRSAVDWLIDRYKTTVDKDTGIRNDPNEFAPENPRYILDLIKRVLTVAVVSLDLIGRLGDMPLNEQPQPAFYPPSWRPAR